MRLPSAIRRTERHTAAIQRSASRSLFSNCATVASAIDRMPALRFNSPLIRAWSHPVSRASSVTRTELKSRRSRFSDSRVRISASALERDLVAGRAAAAGAATPRRNRRRNQDRPRDPPADRCHRPATTTIRRRSHRRPPSTTAPRRARVVLRLAAVMIADRNQPLPDFAGALRSNVAAPVPSSTRGRGHGDRRAGRSTPSANANPASTVRCGRRPAERTARSPSCWPVHRHGDAGCRPLR